jgi:hypothetical protein
MNLNQTINRDQLITAGLGEDKHAALKKVRFPKEELFVKVQRVRNL